ncbi:MAG TPA: dihydroxyacetone kinase [Ruminococcaceae bacterium]|nr:dihydroxyacetone kinase [Oscillospiraceae bacterium]HCK50217.1 dihydroxyacetone kinase [Oscillospiraceae bacterium]
MTLTGKLFRDAVISGANNIANNRAAVDELNVFPVPDGDTGTNMSMTIGNALPELKAAGDGISAGDAAKLTASAMLRGARGNSGVILSLIFRGLSKGLAGQAEADAKMLSDAFKLGVDAAYKSVMKPTEGTILTVVREAWENTKDSAQEGGDAAEFLAKFIGEGEKSLANTPELLPALKKAGVVDAGGKGLLVILSGMQQVISGGGMIRSEEETKPSAPAAVAAAGAAQEDIKFAYCTEFIVNKKPGAKDATALRAFLETIGDCVVVVDDDDIIKVHVHSNHPGKAIEEGIKFGELTKMKIENMREQHHNIIKADEAVQKNRKVPVKPEKDFGFVAVAAGAGIEALFRDLGADSVVRGGQTMNPSTEDILEAIGQTPANNVFVLPNNKNIIMAAEQAVSLADRNVCVLQSRSIPQGITALMNFDPGADFVTNRSNMTDALDRVQSGQITFAVRDSEYDGHKIKQGEILAMDNGKIVFTEKDVTKALVKLTKRLVNSSSSFITVMYGSDVSDEAANAAYEQLRARISDSIDINIVNGGQPVYYYIISVE